MVCRSVEEGRRRVQAQLEETQGRLGESQSARHSLETAKLDMELKVRGMGIIPSFWVLSGALFSTASVSFFNQHVKYVYYMVGVYV